LQDLEKFSVDYNTAKNLIQLQLLYIDFSSSQRIIY